jgi:hypothetical protein
MRAKEINSIINDIHMEHEEKKEVLMIIISSHQHCDMYVIYEKLFSVAALDFIHLLLLIRTSS